MHKQKMGITGQNVYCVQWPYKVSQKFKAIKHNTDISCPLYDQQ